MSILCNGDIKTRPVLKAEERHLRHVAAGQRVLPPTLPRHLTNYASPPPQAATNHSKPLPSNGSRRGAGYLDGLAPPRSLSCPAKQSFTLGADLNTAQD